MGRHWKFSTYWDFGQCLLGWSWYDAMGFRAFRIYIGPFNLGWSTGAFNFGTEPTAP